MKKDTKQLLKETYIQHNPNVPTGRAAIIGFLPILKKSGTNYKTHRIFSDDNFVILHNTYNNAQPFGADEMVTFDIWRIEDGKVAEHWNAVTPIVKKRAILITLFLFKKHNNLITLINRFIRNAFQQLNRSKTYYQSFKKNC